MQAWLARIRQTSRAIKLFIAYSLLANVGIGVFALIFNLYLIRLGYREDFIGQISAATTICIAVAALALGPLTNRYGALRCIIVGLIILVLALLGQALFTAPLFLLLTACLLGVGQAALIVPNMPFIIDYTTQEERADISAITFSVISLSMTAGSLIGGQMPNLLHFLDSAGTAGIVSYRATLIVGILCTALGLLPLLLIGGRQYESAVVSGRLLTSDPMTKQVRTDIIIFVAVGALFSISAAAIVPFYAVYLQELGSPASTIGTIFALSGAFGALVGVFAPMLARRYGVIAVAAGARLAGVPFLVLLIFLPSLPLAFLAYIVRSVAMTLAWPIDSNLISDILPPRQRANAFSLRSAAWNCSWAIASFLVGKMIVLTNSYLVVFITSSLFATLALLLFTLYFRKHPQISDEEARRRAARRQAVA